MSGTHKVQKLYATYLWNQHKKYDLLEAMAGAQGCLDGINRVLDVN